jgi:uncharacterized membrane protein YgaE (UPF0421/DUF939 family)
VRLFGTLQDTKRSPLLQVLKTSAAAVVAWLLSSLLLGQPLPIFAAIAALLVVQPSVNQSLAKGIERSVGVILGVMVAALLGALFGSDSWVILVAIVASLLIAWALKLGPGSTNQIPISGMLVLALGTQTPGYALDRVLETVIGAATALVINALIVPPVLVQPAHHATGKLQEQTSLMLERLALALHEPQDRAQLDQMLLDARELRVVQRTASEAVTRGEESLQLNPRRSRNRELLAEDTALLNRLNALVTRVIGMARAVRDHYDPAIVDDRTVQALVTEMVRAAHDLRLIGRSVAEPNAEDLPALTAPLVITTPGEHWILIGSLLEDMRRVREEIVGATRDA